MILRNDSKASRAVAALKKMRNDDDVVKPIYMTVKMKKRKKCRLNSNPFNI